MDITPLQIWQRLNTTAIKAEKSLNQASEHTGVSSGTISDWKKSFPRVDKFAVVVGFYGVSMDLIFWGKEKAGNQELSEQEANLLRGFRQLDQRDRDDITGNIKMKLDNLKKGDISSNSGNA
jgi:hypothetical protein